MRVVNKIKYENQHDFKTPRLQFKTALGQEGYKLCNTLKSY